MPKKANHCDECHWHVPDCMEATHPCHKGHRPRFYFPKTESPHETYWGFKRRCDDFKEKQEETV